MAKTWYDHLGKPYKSLSALAHKYGMHRMTLQGRLKSGMEMKDALLTPVRQNEGIDYKGKHYPSYAALCRVHDVDPQLFTNRLRDGWTVEDALHKPKNAETTPCEDHKGNKYPSIKEMCAKYDVTPARYLQRIERGWTVREALLGREPKPKNAKKDAASVSRETALRMLEDGMTPNIVARYVTTLSKHEIEKLSESIKN